MKKLLFSLFLLGGSTLFAQQTDFSGNWLLNKAKVDFGQIPEWGVPQSYQIDQAKEKFNIKEINIDEQNEAHKLSEVLNFSGGVETVTTYTGKKREQSVKWNEDKTSFTLIIHTFAADGRPWNNITETWRLTNQGKTLSVNREVKQLNNGFNYSISLFYEKRP